MPPPAPVVLALSAGQVWLAVVLGPLFLPLALEFVRRREPAARAISLDPRPRAGSGRHAIVARLGEAESVVDALPVLASFGSVTALTLATPIDYESADRAAPDEVRREAEPEHDLIVITGATVDVGAERLSDVVGVPVVVAPRHRERGTR